MKTITRVSFAATFLFTLGAVIAVWFGKTGEPAAFAAIIWAIPSAIAFALCAKNGPDW